MNVKGKALDEIFTERITRSVKTTNVNLYVYENGLTLRKSIDDFLDFCNNIR